MDKHTDMDFTTWLIRTSINVAISNGRSKGLQIDLNPTSLFLNNFILPIWGAVGLQGRLLINSINKMIVNE
jgi:hypothetical protein